jgi:quinoprotein glucose dehydrogenase
MSRRILNTVLAILVIVGGLAVMVTPGSSQNSTSGQGQYAAKPSTANGEWPEYTADLAGSKYSPLDQINAENFNDLEVAWSFKTDAFGPRPENKLEGTPLMVKGVIYATAGTRRTAVALDGKTGELLWMYRMDEGRRADMAPRKLSGRGLAYWTDGLGDERIILVTIGYRMVALDAKTGIPVDSFGRDGVVDLKLGVIIGADKQVDLVAGEVGLHSTAAVVGNKIIVGSSMAEGLGYRYSINAKGLVRAFDAQSGDLLWGFDGVPGPGQFGNDTWEGGSWEWTGNNGVWTEITVDEEAGIAYLPIETPTIDEYGGNRLGDNLFAETLVAVDLETGRRLWHFQLVHHPIWDHDISAAPLLMDVTIDGRERKVVAQPGKQGWLYVFDRITGEPIWPIPEVAVPQTDVPGEKTAATQPMPTKPPPFSRTHLAREDVIDFTPELRAQALENLAKYRWEEIAYIPHVGPGSEFLGSINVGTTLGGINWPGASFDPETGIFYGQAHNSQIRSTKFTQEYFDTVKPETQAANRIPIWEDEVEEVRGRRGRGRGRGPRLTDGLEGLPIVKPPYGVLTALDINSGELLFQVPHGDTTDDVRAALDRLGIDYPEKAGQGYSVGLLVTKTLVILGDPRVTSPPGRERGAMLRAYDKQTGEEVGAVWMPTAQSGSPMTYMIDGRQYIIVAVSGGNYSGEYIAYALPE